MIHSIDIVNAINNGNMIHSPTSGYNDGMDETNLFSPGQRLAFARESAGYATAADFAEKAGITATTYRAYENDQNGYAKHANRFAKLLSVTSEWLLEGGPVPDAPSAGRNMMVMDGLKDQLNIEMIRKVDIGYAMGDGAVIEDYPDTGLVPFDREFLRAIGARNTERLFLSNGEGDSMAPTLYDNDLVLIDASHQRVTMQDRIWALTVAGAGMIKRLRALPGDQLMVMSDNPAVPPQTLSLEDVFIVGRVLWIGRRM
jgi:phage repressor protein C with HTH and peptisase S24 domain